MEVLEINNHNIYGKWCDMDNIENTTSNNFSISARVFVCRWKVSTKPLANNDRLLRLHYSCMLRKDTDERRTHEPPFLKWEK